MKAGPRAGAPPIRSSPDLAEEPGVQAGQLGGHVLLVHVVELVERRPGREAALHQVQHRHHTCRRRREQLTSCGALRQEVMSRLRLTGAL